MQIVNTTKVVVDIANRMLNGTTTVAGTVDPHTHSLSVPLPDDLFDVVKECREQLQDLQDQIDELWEYLREQERDRRDCQC